MKFVNKILTKKWTFALVGLSLAVISCDDYLDVDTDTDNSTVAPLPLLLADISVSVNNTTDFQFYTGDILQVYTHQMTVREEQDQYGARVDNTLINNEWNNTYLALTNIETLISQATESGDLVYVGIAQMHKAYLMSVAVDLWGDVPFTEANKLSEGIVSPVFDNQAAIYASVFELIETAKGNIASNEGILKPGADDLFYKGDRNRWIRFANSFKLKLYNQTRLSTSFDQAGFDALVAEGNFFIDNADDFQFVQTANQSPSDERNKLFLSSYNGTQFSTYMSPWFYEILKGVNPTIHTGLADPRMPYYFFNQLVPDQFPPDQGNTATGDPRADYWDASTGFFSIRFGSVGPWRDSSTENSATYPGVFPAGGRYDDGLGGRINDIMAGTVPGVLAPSGVAPHRIFTYDEFLFTQAELILVGKLSGDAGAKLNDAILANFAKIDLVVKNNGTPGQTGVPTLATANTAAAAFVTAILAEYATGSDAKKLEIIMTQKWVATFGDPMDQYNDYRRTGYPVLANPLSTSPEYQLNNNDGFPIVDSQTTLNSPFQVSLYWPQNELNVNQNAPAQKDATAYKIFWDN